MSKGKSPENQGLKLRENIKFRGGVSRFAGNRYRKEDVAKIFDREKILIGNKDAVPRYRAVEIFGEDAVAFSERLGRRGSNGCMYGIGDYSLQYLTDAGMEVAATYVNISAIRSMLSEEEGVANV